MFLWGRRADTADTLCQGRETLGTFLGLLPGPCPCSPAPSGTHWEGDVGWTQPRGRAVFSNCSTAHIPAPAREANAPSASPREEMLQASPSSEMLLGRRYPAKTSALNQNLPSICSQHIIPPHKHWGMPASLLLLFSKAFSGHKGYFLPWRFFSCLAEKKCRCNYKSQTTDFSCLVLEENSGPLS